MSVDATFFLGLAKHGVAAAEYLAAERAFFAIMQNDIRNLLASFGGSL